MTQDPNRLEQDRQLIREAAAQGTGAKLLAYTRLSGPGWLQSAITLGGGSLGGSLYLGVLAGFGLMWLQPLAMILGVIMLSAIGYVALSTGEKPFRAINTHINPVLGWGWAIATLMANMVWCMPQFALGTAAVQQNLAPELLGEGSSLTPNTAKAIIVVCLFLAAGLVVWSYDSGSRGIRLFERLLKLMVGTVVICFFGVVLRMSFAGVLDWPQILGGFVPDFSLLTQPSERYSEVLQAAGGFQDFWTQRIVRDQQQVMITAAATAVGINMTFLLPYSMLQRGWDRDFRGLGIFDLSTGLFVPFVLATSCVVIAAASQFHGQTAIDIDAVTAESGSTTAKAKLVGGFHGNLDARISEEIGKEEFAELSDERKQALRDELPRADRELAAMLVRRDAFDLAAALENLTGRTMSHLVFGIGVLGMAVSTIIILMLINGFVICEIFGLPHGGVWHRGGAALAGLSGAMGPFIWGGAKAQVWLVVPTSMFGMVLLPIAYFTFLFMMNSRSLLGDDRPSGIRRLWWNSLMIVAAGLATLGCYWSVRSSSYANYGMIGIGAFIALAVIVHFVRKSASPADGNPA